MFKNLQLFQAAANLPVDLASAESVLDPMRFIECGASQEKSTGWVEPRGEKHGPLIEASNGQWFLKMMTESKILPGSVVKAEAQRRFDAVETREGRKPGRKEKKDITEAVRQDLMLKAFTKKSTTLVWIDQAKKTIVVGTSSQSLADLVVTELIRAFSGLAITRVQTHQSPSAAMSMWLSSQEAPANFSTDQDCTLAAKGDSKATVKYGSHPLDLEEITAHIEGGLLPTQLAMTWSGDVSFVLTESGMLKKIEYLDGVYDGQSAAERVAGFDADAAIVSGTLSKLIPDLLEALGGAVSSEQ